MRGDPWQGPERRAAHEDAPVETPGRGCARGDGEAADGKQRHGPVRSHGLPAGGLSVDCLSVVVTATCRYASSVHARNRRSFSEYSGRTKGGRLDLCARYP